MTILVSAQNKQYISVSEEIGYTSLRYNFEGADNYGGLGFGGKLGYSYFFSENWGVGTGIGIFKYNTSGTLGQVKTNKIDSEGIKYIEEVNFGAGWMEKQDITFVEIPLLLNYEQAFDKDSPWKFYANAGVRFQIATKSSYLIDGGETNFEVRGDYPELYVEFYDVENQGLKVVGCPKTTGELSIKNSIAATVGLGTIYKLNDNFDIFGGVIVDYGLNNIKNIDEEVSLVNEDKGVYKYNSLLIADINPRVSTFAVKLELGLRYLIGGNSKDEIPDDTSFIREKEIKATVIATEELENSTAKMIHELEALEKLQGAKLYFKLNKYILTDEQKERINTVIPLLRRHSDMKIHLTGHACNIGTREVNYKEGLLRAEAVRDYFVSMGISEDKIDVMSKGEDNPEYSNDTEAGRVKNRYVLLHIDRD